MDINYHYFAVKSLALKAGYIEDDAQLLASYSQFVDDFDLYAYMYLDNVPDYARHLAYKLPNGKWLFNPVTTGFNSLPDFARLILDRYQRRVVIPFHFIPLQRLNTKQTSRANWRTIPASLDTPSLMTELLTKAKQQYIDKQERYNLMRIGMLLHTFADTYAHQGFSGFQGWENHSMLTKVINNINNEEITASYEPGRYFLYPSIGHVNVNHAPDDSNVRFEIRQKLNQNDDYSIYYNRSNTRDFVDISKEIINFLLSCKGKDKIDEAEWEVFYPLLVQGFKTEQKDIGRLCSYWKSIFPENEYYYSKESLLKSQIDVSKENEFMLSAEGELLDILRASGQTVVSSTLMTIKSEDFFHYNVMAKQICDEVNGFITESREFKEYADNFSSKFSTSSF